MKKSLLLLLFLIIGLNLKIQATHLTGAELTYKVIGLNTYEVNFKLYRECGSAAYATSTDVQVKAPGCNSGRNITLNLISQEERSLTGINSTNSCGNFNSIYYVATYSGVLTFSAAEQTCTDWVLSWETCCRTDLANLNNASTMGLYTEAHLKLLPNLVNNSPAFDTINYQGAFAALGQPILISALAHDADGDSLVYSSVAPLSAANQPMVYNPVSVANGTIVNPNPQPPFNTTTNPQVAVFPPNLNSYSAAWPIISYNINWVAGQQVNIAQPYFDLNPQTGNIAFQPAVFNPNVNLSLNRYVVAIQVDEYRRIKGVVTKIGSVRRDTYIQVVDGAGNANPIIDQVTMNGVTLEEGDIINLRPGVTMNLTFSATDMNATDDILMRSNVNSLLPGAIFSQNGAAQPSGSITWTPTANDVRKQPYYFNVVLKDNAGAMRGYHERTIGVRVTSNGSVTGLRDEQEKLTNFAAYPNPFTDQVNFTFNSKTKSENIIIYNLLGQQIDEIQLKTLGLGEQEVQWQNAAKQPAGTYIAKMISADKTIQTLKFIKLQ